MDDATREYIKREVAAEPPPTPELLERVRRILLPYLASDSRPVVENEAA